MPSRHDDRATPHPEGRVKGAWSLNREAARALILKNHEFVENAKDHVRRSHQTAEAGRALLQRIDAHATIIRNRSDR